MKIKYAVITGKNIFHPIFMSWSYLYLGKAARTRINIKQKNVIFMLNMNIGDAHDILKKGNQPPKNKMVIKAAINIILLYSPKKNIAKIIEEYSTL